MEPNCPHCKSTESTGLRRVKAGVHVVLIICCKCGAILAAVNDIKT
jgi:transcription elongation factor Elf1